MQVGTNIKSVFFLCQMRTLSFYSFQFSFRHLNRYIYNQIHLNQLLQVIIIYSLFVRNILLVGRSKEDYLLSIIHNNIIYLIFGHFFFNLCRVVGMSVCFKRMPFFKLNYCLSSGDISFLYPFFLFHICIASKQ